MLLRASLLFVVVLAVGACAPAVSVTREPSLPTSTRAEAPASVSYYGGTITVTSPDGKTPYGPPTATFVSRAIDPAAGTIVETTIDDGKVRTTTLKRRGDTNVFDASDDAGSFAGTITFVGEGWSFTGWRYAIAMTDKSGSIAGTATITPMTITTEKVFTAADGTPRAKIVDVLQTIDKQAYDAGRETLTEP